MKIDAKMLGLAALVLSGCVATDVGNPDDGEFGTTFDFVGYDDDSSATMETNANPNSNPMVTGLTLNSGIEIDRVVFGFNRFKLRDAQNCEGDNEIDVEMFVVSELLEGTDYPELPRIVRDVNQFCRFELQIKTITANDQPDGAPDDILGRAMFIEGRYADGTPFTIETREDDQLRLAPSSDDFFELPDEESRLFLAFDMNSWFDGLDLNQFRMEEGEMELEDDPVFIDKDLDEDWTKAFRENVSDSARLFRDLDDDGTLDPAERENSLAVGTSGQ